MFIISFILYTYLQIIKKSMYNVPFINDYLPIVRKQRKYNFQRCFEEKSTTAFFNR